MTTKITLEDLKSNRQQIINYVNETNEFTGNYIDLKEMMNFMLEQVNNNDAEIKEDEKFEDYIVKTYDFMRPRSRKTSRIAEMIGEMEFKGYIEPISVNDRLKNKYTK